MPARAAAARPVTEAVVVGPEYAAAVPTTLGDALSAAKLRLAQHRIPATDADELLSRLLGVGRNDLRLGAALVLAGDDLQRLDAWLERRLSGEPVQYITGRAAFRGIDLAVDARVLVPRPETELLVEVVLGILRRAVTRWPTPRVLDLGTGSGAIALAIAHELPQARVWATDASSEALALARDNAVALGLVDRMTFTAGDWFDAIARDERFEAIVSNPPYIATTEWDDLPDEVRNHEPHAALFSGETGLEALREIIDQAPRHLVTDGLLALELSERRAAEVAGWLEGAHDWSEVELRDDLTGRPRILVARREHGPAIAPQQWREEG